MKKVESKEAYGYAYLIGIHTPDAVTGKIMEIIEAIGLPEKQDEAVKNLIKQVVYDKIINKAVYISDCLNGSIRKALKKQGNENFISAVKLDEIK